MAATKQRHNKQHDARAASFHRIAKDIRAIGKERGWSFLGALAKAFDKEAKLLRSMR